MLPHEHKFSNLELLVYHRLCAIRKPEVEYRFHPIRKWRFDFAYPQEKIAIECEGAVWNRGRHTRGGGFINDCEKYNEATIMGWRVLRYSRQTIDQITDDLKGLL